MLRPLPTELRKLLRRVSRSFYLTISMLPQRIRPQIGIAYLLARATDTIADTQLVPVKRRLDALRDLRETILESAQGRTRPVPAFGDLAAAVQAPAGQGASGERDLLLSLDKVLGLLRAFSPEDCRLLHNVLVTIISGQELDLERFGNASGERIAALQSQAELDDYTYRVAGCVGEFWTKICRAHLFPTARLEDEFLLENGVRFGKGLQLVNILRDLPGDLRHGRCYLPLEQLAQHALVPEALLQPASMNVFRPLYDVYLELAEGHLAAGWAYTNALPLSQMRVRLSCAWPILIGIRTLARLRTRNVLDERNRIKISRSEIRRLILRSVVCYPAPAKWSRLIQEVRQKELLTG